MKMYIGNKLVDACDKTTIKIINPATGNLIDTVPNAGPEDVLIAVRHAKTAQKKWRDVHLYQRIMIIEKFCMLVKENQDELACTLTAETGKPISVSRGEISGVISIFKTYIEAVKHIKKRFYSQRNAARARKLNVFYFT